MHDIMLVILPRPQALTDRTMHYINSLRRNEVLHVYCLYNASFYQLSGDEAAGNKTISYPEPAFLLARGSG